VPHPLLSRLRVAVRHNARPALLLQALTLALLGAYAWWPAARAAFEALMRLKLAWGVGYAFLAGALFAGMLPRLVMRWSGASRAPLARELAFAMLFWGYRGVEIDLFYQLQAHWFGTAADWPTVIVKTVVDQFVYSPVWSVPMIALVFAWKDAGFSWRVLREHLDAEFFALRLPSAVAGNLMVWLPSVVAIYFLPLPLQLPVSNLVASFWVLLMIMLLDRAPRRAAELGVVEGLQDTLHDAPAQSAAPASRAAHGPGADAPGA